MEHAEESVLETGRPKEDPPGDSRDQDSMHFPPIAKLSTRLHLFLDYDGFIILTNVHHTPELPKWTLRRSSITKHPLCTLCTRGGIDISSRDLPCR